MNYIRKGECHCEHEKSDKLIHIGKPIEFDEMQFYLQLNNLKHAVESECADVRPLIQEIVPTYVPKKNV